MRLKFLLVFLMFANIVSAQEPEPYRNLVISEVYMIFGEFGNVYLEVTNMGEKPIDLREIEFWAIHPGKPVYDVWNDPWVTGSDRKFFLPESVAKVLQPGESYLITFAYDFALNLFKAREPGYGWADRAKRHDIYPYADFLIHRYEKVREDMVELYPHIKDSVTLYYLSENDTVGTHVNYSNFGFANMHQIGFALNHHFAEGESAVIDQVGNMFDGNGLNSITSWSVAGVEDATTTAVLFRQYKIKTGNLDFANARGVGLDDSEWMAIRWPEDADMWRDTWWTVGNHGDYVLDANTLEPKTDDIKVDFGGKTITVPWGTRRLDDIMRKMERKPGVAWVYHLNESVEDSLLRSAQNGDKLTVYVVGETLYTETFDILVKEPTEDANIVVPIDHVNLGNIFEGGPVTENVQHGKLGWPRVTQNQNGIDTIWGGGYGLPHAIRTDSLMKYLEKPANASWEFVFADGIERADLKNGDKLKVIAQNGAIKEYFLEVQSYSPSQNANLSAITWPDISISETDQIIYGWRGDTIPGFRPGTMIYRLTLPSNFEGIPALIPQKEDLNSTIEVNRAKSIEGTVADRTTVFDITAEDDSVVYKKSYSVELYKEPDTENMQPYHAEPFISEVVMRNAIGSGSENNQNFLEICNPGNQPLDLSDYMLVSGGNSNPADLINSFMGKDQWLLRYNKYVPGYKWVSEYDWIVQPGMLEFDLGVNAVVQPGDVFCMGSIVNDNHLEGEIDYSEWGILDELDVQFMNRTLKYGVVSNPWGEEVPEQHIPMQYQAWTKVFLLKILNDSIKQGRKPANDPNDFELIDAVGVLEGNGWYIGGTRFWGRGRIIRKAEYITGNPLLEVDFGTNMEDSEWILSNEATLTTGTLSEKMLYLESNIGQHYFKTPTQYMSTVTAVVYKVSKGYSMEETIEGVLTGTTASEFLGNIYKADSAQTLTLKATADGSELSMDAVLSANDTLVVLSADSTNTTKYILEVSETGLSSNARLTSDRYQIKIEVEPKSVTVGDENAGAGYITGFEYGTQLRTVLNNVTVPPGASLSIIDGDGAYVPLKMLNFDTTYVSVTVNPDIYFDVVAENGVTRIVYQIQPLASGNDVFILSDIYTVMQAQNLVNFVPRGTNVQTLLSNITPTLGATVKVVDKMGLERTEGTLYEDDKVVVTSSNGLVTKVYHLSMLRTQYIPETTYLAYVLSNVYAVDQVDYTITGPTATTLLSDFYARITPSMGATAVVVDANGIEKTTGDLNDGDMLRVTSADGKIVVMYELKLDLTSVDLTGVQQIEIYPNPTTGRLNVRGVEQGGRIQVFNAVGTAVLDIHVSSSPESILLSDQPSGMYMIVVSKENKLLGRFKAVKQ